MKTLIMIIAGSLIGIVTGCCITAIFLDAGLLIMIGGTISFLTSGSILAVIL